MPKDRNLKNKKGKGSQGFNRKKSEDFLEKNRLKADVVETDSGLQYTIIDKQDGASPTIEDRVIVHQRISLVDGTMIEDTYQKNDPVEFSLAEAIEGYREGLLLMTEGSRYKFFIPSDLAWGKRGAGSKIGPNATLIIDVRLLEIK